MPRKLQGRNVRSWTIEQRIEQSRKRRGNSDLDGVTENGRLHYELVRHLVDCNRLEQILSYEAFMNGVELKEWIERHRIAGRPHGTECYLPPGTSILSKDGNLFNTHISNLYVFEAWGARASWEYYRKKGEIKPLPQNEEQIIELSQKYSWKRREELERIQSSIL